MRLFPKILMTILLLVFSTLTFARGPGMTAVEASPPPSKPQRNGVYVDLSAGYAMVKWSTFDIGAFNGYSSAMDGTVTSNENGGFTFGFDLGYQINNFTRLEAGWYYLPTVKGTSDISTTLPDLRVESWLAYVALKVMVPLSERFDIFGKVGLGYRSLTLRGSAIGFPGFGVNETDYVSGIFGAGLQYWFDDNWSVSVQDLYMMSNKTGAQISPRAPAANLILGSVGYMFAV